MVTTERRTVATYLQQSGYPTPEAAPLQLPAMQPSVDEFHEKQHHSSDDWLSLRIDRADQSIMVHRFSFQGPKPY